MFRRNRKKPPAHPPPTATNVSLTLAMLGVTSFLAGSVERKRLWQIGALVSSFASFVSAGLLATLGNRRWVRIPVGASFILTIAAQRRIGLRIRGEREKRRWWHRFRPKARQWRPLTVRPAEVSWNPDEMPVAAESA